MKPEPPPLPLPADARSALLVVDMQAYYFRLPERRVGLEEALTNLRRLIDAFDARGEPVVHVRTAFRPDGSDWELKMRSNGQPLLLEDSPEAGFLPGIPIRPRHTVVTKTRYSAFFNTDLAARLHAQGAARVMVTGAYTHYCVNATVMDAYCHDFVPGVITDAVLSHLPAEAALMLRRMRRNGYHLFTTAAYLATMESCLSVKFPSTG